MIYSVINHLNVISLILSYKSENNRISYYRYTFEKLKSIDFTL